MIRIGVIGNAGRGCYLRWEASISFSSGRDIRKSRARLPEGMDLFEALAEGARFEISTAPETIDLDLLLAFRSQALTNESEEGDEPIKTDGTR